MPHLKVTMTSFSKCISVIISSNGTLSGEGHAPKQNSKLIVTALWGWVGGGGAKTDCYCVTASFWNVAVHTFNITSYIKNFYQAVKCQNLV